MSDSENGVDEAWRRAIGQAALADALSDVVEKAQMLRDEIAVEMDDARLSYVTAQINRDALAEFRAALTRLSDAGGREQPTS